MKKMFLATCLLAAAVFAAPEATAPAAPAAEPAQPAAAPAEQAAAPAAPAAEAAPAEQAAAPAAPAAEAAPAEQAAAPAAPAAEAAPVEQAAAPEAPAAEAAPAEQAAAPEAPAAEAAPAEQAAAEAPAAEAAPAEQAAAEAPAAEAAPAEEVAAAEPAKEEVVAKKAPEKKPAKKKRKKKKLVNEEDAVIKTQKLAFDINADFELEAGKVFWTSEDDENGDNLETWNGEANFAILAEGDDFKGKIGVAFYPGDLASEPAGYNTKREKREMIREDKVESVDDYFSLDEAWAMQETDLFSFKVGRWDNTDKNGDYFGGYIDGYLAGFMSTQNSENQLQFGFTPSDNVDFFVSLISGSSHLNKGDLRAAFNFHGLQGISDLNIQLAYRSNLFDVVYDSDSEVKHNASLKANLPVVQNYFNIFAEAALMNIDPDEDMIIPVTGGIAVFTPVVDRIILEAEYIADRDEHPEYQGFKAKHVKDVLGAIYLEKSFTDRFSLSAGFHSYGSTKDYMLSGNLIGRIN
ncbi:MAG: hypothetical protein MJY47_01970 [Fibrobacter sp.]|nr:hypothetical protein [Fibrobacter sp.]